MRHCPHVKLQWIPIFQIRLRKTATTTVLKGNKCPRSNLWHSIRNNRPKPTSARQSKKTILSSMIALVIIWKLTTRRFWCRASSRPLASWKTYLIASIKSQKLLNRVAKESRAKNRAFLGTSQTSISSRWIYKSRKGLRRKTLSPQNKESPSIILCRPWSGYNNSSNGINSRNQFSRWS